ncbi:MAG: hypothetical protein LBC91_01980 [Candidatus Accumulibacter sp.]|nr:hypothetical protein [Accumulibacter sp.]
MNHTPSWSSSALIEIFVVEFHTSVPGLRRPDRPWSDGQKRRAREGRGVRHLFDPAVNIQVGVRVLEEAIRRRGGLTAGLQYYAGSSDASGRYANKVLAEKARLEKAASRAERP